MFSLKTMELFDFIKLIGSLCAAITTIAAFIIAVFKPIRKRFIENIKKFSRSEEQENLIKTLNESMSELKVSVDRLNQEYDKNNSATQASLRNEITYIYYKNLKDKTLRTYVKKNLISLVEAYFAIGGNSYVKCIFEEMMEWDVID